MNKINKKNVYYVQIIISIIMITFSFDLKGQDHKKIIETIQVKNIEFPVRVFQGNHPVGGLKKQDFQLYINGEKKEINGFYEIRQQLDEINNPEIESSQILQQKEDMESRFFVLIFNISSFDNDLSVQLDTLFDRILKPNDRIIVLTNRYFLPECEIGNKKTSKQRILNILNKETKTMKMELLACETELKSLSENAIARLDATYGSGASESPAAIFREFFQNYQFVLEQIKDKYLNIPIDQYIKIADYLKSLRMDKWVLIFYQMGRLPMLDNLGKIKKRVESILNTVRRNPSIPIMDDPITIRQELLDYYVDYFIKFQMTKSIYNDDIGKSFLNSGATVHTQLLIPKERIFSQEFQYQVFNTESESIVKKLAHITGGSVITSNNTDKFISNIAKQEDIIYMITYAPHKSKKRKNKFKINLKVKNKNYRVVFDDQKRLKSFEKMMDVIKENQKNIEIDSITWRDGLLAVNVKNIQVVLKGESKFGAVETHIKILDKNNQLISAFKKSFKSKKRESSFQTSLPSLSPGEYFIIVEVKDLFSFKSIVSGDAISIIKK